MKIAAILIAFAELGSEELAGVVAECQQRVPGPERRVLPARRQAIKVVRRRRVRTSNSQVRTSNGPQIMTALRDVVVTALRLAGVTNIAAALRRHAREPHRPLITYRSRIDFASALAGERGLPRGDRTGKFLSARTRLTVISEIRLTAQAGPRLHRTGRACNGKYDARDQ